MSGLQIVWFKRDLRAHDHRALAAAAARGPILPLYVIEPEMWAQSDASARQWRFVAETLEALQRDLAELGQPLIVRHGSILEVLEALCAEHGVDALWSHEETGNAWSYARDRAVAAWCRARGLPWHEMQNHGVQRRLASRNGWASAWDRFMDEPVTPAPPLMPLEVELGYIPDECDLGLAADPCDGAQKGGRAQGLRALHSFLHVRGRPYRSAMSSPTAGAEHCSRLSPYLAWGALSLREVHQATEVRRAEPLDGRWRASLKSFLGRLHWHCHFIQKLEDEPRLECENLHGAYDGLRPRVPDARRLQAWAEGETGLPFVDACMRSLRATGWLNFRMRAMVMSVASYHLWLDWRATGAILARRFTDYEPGIHWPQVQMQSGTTGINTVRIYNPVKQGQDQDPTGAFTRRWVPELGAIDDAYLQEPWRAPNAGAVLGRVYPHPIVDPQVAARAAREAVWAVRKGDSFKSEKQQILKRHAPRKGARRAKSQDRRQMSFDL